MNANEQSLALIDRYMAAVVKGSAAKGNPVHCHAGCYFCCKEPVYADRAEVEYMVADLDPEHRARATEKTKVWWDGFVAAGLDDAPVPEKGGGYQHLLKYRAQKLWCPLLENGLCSVYSRRPSSCRIHVAIRSPARCERDELRPKQVFALTDQQDGVEGEAMRLLTGGATRFLFQMDHLGIWLGHLLLGKTERSAAGANILATMKGGGGVTPSAVGD